MPDAEPIITVLRRAYPLRFNSTIRPAYDRLVAALQAQYADESHVLAALEHFLIHPRDNEDALAEILDNIAGTFSDEVVTAARNLWKAVDAVAPPPSKSKKRDRTDEKPLAEFPPSADTSSEEQMEWLESLDSNERGESGFTPPDEGSSGYAEEEADQHLDDDPITFADVKEEAAPPPPPSPAAPPAPAPQEVIPPDLETVPEPEPYELDWLGDMTADVDTEVFDNIDDEAAVEFDALATEEAPVMSPPGAPTDVRKPTPQVRVVDEAHFSAYYPPQVARGPVYGLYVYAHTPEALRSIQRDISQFEDRLGGSVPEPASAGTTSLLAHGAVLTVVPEADGVTFDPPMQTRTWRGDWLRFDFDFTVSAMVDSVPIRASIQVAGIEIAHVMCAVAVMDRGRSYRSLNPLLDAKLNAASGQMYQNIFISYAREDIEVARAYRLAQQAAGHDVFMDSYSIRAGEDWQAALANAIDDADIFQLFWSAHSAVSENVRDEWEYALDYRCPEDACAGFIRPVYWQRPLIDPPPELDHLNFKFVPLVADENDTPTTQATSDDVNAQIADLADQIHAMRGELADIKNALRMLYNLVQEKLR